MAKSKKSPPPRQTAKQLAQTPLPALVQQKLAQALALAEQGRADEAYATLRSLTEKAGSSLGKSAGALLNAAARKVAKRHPATALAMAREVVRHEPGLSAAWLTIAVTSDQLGEHAAAHAACRTIVGGGSADPADVLTACDLLARFGDERLALDAAKGAFAALGRPLYGADRLLYIALRSADWALADELIAMLERAHHEGQVAQALESPHNVLMWCNDPAINIAVAARMATLNIEQATPPWRGAIAPLSGRRIRVGYLSSDFREHATAWLVNGLFRHHDREKFELFMYCSGWDDGSAIRRELESHMDHVHAVAKLDNHSVAELIRSHKIDVLVELNGLTRAGRLDILAERVAPVQIDYLGFPGSVGGRGVDYIVADDYIVPPGGEALYPEKLIRIGDTYQVNDYAARKPPLALTRAQVGLPDRPVVVAGMFNHLRKVRGEVWTAWMRILKAVPHAVMWVLDPGELARDNIRSFTAAAGVDPERIFWAPKLPQETHLMRLQCCDLILDPWPCGGHTTLTDALFVGVPHVCLQGRSFAARVNGSLLRAAELDFLVQPDVDSYVDLAVLLLRFPEQLAAIKRIILDNVFKTDVFNAESKTRQLEQAYRIALERVSTGLQPEHISLHKIVRPPSPVPLPAGPGRTGETAPALAPELKPPVFLLCSPWHTGSEALAAKLQALGLRGLEAGPTPEGEADFVASGDAFGELMHALVSEESLQRRLTTPETIDAIKRFRDTHFADFFRSIGDGGSMLLSHPLAALVLDELVQFFDLRLVIVRRPLLEIEQERQQAGTPPSTGQAGAAVIYTRLADGIERNNLPCKSLKYEDIEDTRCGLPADLTDFCGLAQAGDIGDEEPLLAESDICSRVATQARPNDSLQKAASRTANPRRFHVVIATPPGYRHGETFREISETLQAGLIALGHSATASGDFAPDATNIVLAPHLLSVEKASEIPADSILYNFEQVTGESSWMKPFFVGLTRRFTLWEYSARNVDMWRRCSPQTKVVHVPLGYVSELSRIAQDTEDIDVLFYGSLNERRKKLIEELKAAGIKVMTVFGVYGKERDELIARAKLILNIHFYESKIFEIAQVSYLLANRKAVVSELDAETEIDDSLRSAIAGVPYRKLKDTCIKLLRDEKRRRELAQRGYDIFSRMDESAILESALAETAAPKPDIPVALPTRLNVGSGKAWNLEWLNLDINPMWMPDWIANLNQPIPSTEPVDLGRFGLRSVPEDYFEEIRANDVLEHLPDVLTAMSSFLRLLRVGGILSVQVPYDLSLGAWQDPTHVRAFNENSWLYYTDWFWYLGWKHHRFELADLQFILSPYGATLKNQGRSMDEIRRTPRAIDAMHVKLRKIELTAQEREKVSKPWI